MTELLRFVYKLEAERQKREIKAALIKLLKTKRARKAVANV
jgi:hypothetical protein